MAKSSPAKSPAGLKTTLQTGTELASAWSNPIRAVVLLFLAAAFSVLSQLALAPVYGSTPAHVYHEVLCNIALVAGLILKSHFPQLFHHDEKLLPVLLFSIPNIQSVLFQYSSHLGNPSGPLLTELVTTAPLLLLSGSIASAFIGSLKLQRYGSSFWVPIVGAVLFKSAHDTTQSTVPLYLGSTLFLTTFGLQIVLAVLYTVIISPKLTWLLLALPSLLLSLTVNVHMPFERTATRLNSTLHESNYSLVDRQESLTGYISVLDNMEVGFRAMRCDHSLLGGEWTRRPTGYNPTASDPIYAVFTMLEAVRLAESDSDSPRNKDSHSNALVIGLGIGTTPAALIQHGVNTTIVEIDPVVYKFALQYFHFPENHTAVIDNAVTFVENARLQSKQYEYIVHDVFTGGTEPIDLFTLEFMQGLYALLKENGIVAINYAGDLSLPSAGLVVRTIRSVFPLCRIFRENGSDKSDSDPLGFTNMVIFCKKTSKEPLNFRAPQPNDYLGSKSRKAYMYPQHEINPNIFGAGDTDTNQQVLQIGKTELLKKYHTQSAIGHWKIMRTVLPAKVWENF
ncbi:spermine/spermidine synthase family protein [Talaromyces proteolyticus]|uniref:Spermine/spermidine synthase family protein n=1 Tax=Talaromyces proteolyticus TaxID=1131652 RepID=A0AAD4L245_9EURO|nr:spermine/spermidine synthase family protein [Talaromyces proteolyticus]KAH8701819.1 spermine/spermidine synthase family protein [Talaromyces proteolyticus]